MFEMCLSSYPHNIFDGYQQDDVYDGHMERWAQQLADAAPDLTPEQVADKLEGSLNVNCRWLEQPHPAYCRWRAKC